MEFEPSRLMSPEQSMMAVLASAASGKYALAKNSQTNDSWL